MVGGGSGWANPLQPLAQGQPLMFSKLFQFLIRSWLFAEPEPDPELDSLLDIKHLPGLAKTKSFDYMIEVLSLLDMFFVFIFFKTRVIT